MIFLKRLFSVISIFLLFPPVTLSYTLSIEDNNLINGITQKIESIISKKWENKRELFISKLNIIKNKCNDDRKLRIIDEIIKKVKIYDLGLGILFDDIEESPDKLKFEEASINSFSDTKKVDRYLSSLNLTERDLIFLKKMKTEWVKKWVYRRLLAEIKFKQEYPLWFHIVISQLNYSLPHYTKICLPETKQFCDEGKCNNVKATVFVLYDEDNNKIYRCDNNPCDGYDTISKKSGKYVIIEPIAPRHYSVKISVDNKYIESAGLLLSTYISYGKCTSR